MKKLILICWLLLINVIPLWSQIEKSETRASDQDKCIQELLLEISRGSESRAYYIHQPLSHIYDRLKNSCFRIKHMSTMSEGPWSQPDGKEYMTGVILYNKTLKEMHHDKQEVYVVRIALHIWIDDRKFWNSLPNNASWMKAIQEKTKDMIVENISFKKTLICSETE